MGVNKLINNKYKFLLKMDDILIYNILPQLIYLDIRQFCLVNKHYNTFYSKNNYELLYHTAKFISPIQNITRDSSKNIHIIWYELYGKITSLIKNKITICRGQY